MSRPEENHRDVQMESGELLCLLEEVLERREKILTIAGIRIHPMREEDGIRLSVIMEGVGTKIEYLLKAGSQDRWHFFPHPRTIVVKNTEGKQTQLFPASPSEHIAVRTDELSSW